MIVIASLSISSELPLIFMCVFQEEGDQEKSVALEELEKTLRQQHEQTELSYSDKMSQLNVQLQQLDTVVSQVQLTINWSTIHTANENSKLSVTNLNI